MLSQILQRMVLIFISCSSNLQFMNAKPYKYISFNWTCSFEVFVTDLSQFLSIFLIILRLNNNGTLNFRPLYQPYYKLLYLFILWRNWFARPQSPFPVFPECQLHKYSSQSSKLRYVNPMISGYIGDRPQIYQQENPSHSQK